MRAPTKWHEARVVVLAAIYPEGEQSAVLAALNAGDWASAPVTWCGAQAVALKHGIRRSRRATLDGIAITMRAVHKIRLDKRWPAERIAAAAVLYRAGRPLAECVAAANAPPWDAHPVAAKTLRVRLNVVGVVRTADVMAAATRANLAVGRLSKKPRTTAPVRVHPSAPPRLMAVPVAPLERPVAPPEPQPGPDGIVALTYAEMRAWAAAHGIPFDGTTASIERVNRARAYRRLAPVVLIEDRLAAMRQVAA